MIQQKSINSKSCKSSNHANQGSKIKGTDMFNEILSTLKKRQGESLKKNNGNTLNDTVSDIVNLIRADPKITLDELALILNKSRRTITRHMKKFQDEGIISRTGSDKAGYWKVKD